MRARRRRLDLFRSLVQRGNGLVQLDKPWLKKISLKNRRLLTFNTKNSKDHISRKLFRFLIVA